MQGLQVWFNIWKLASMIYQAQIYHLGFPGGSVVKNLPANAWEEGLISRWGKMLWTKNSIHSSILAQGIPLTEESGGLQSIGSPKSRTQLSDNNL